MHGEHKSARDHVLGLRKGRQVAEGAHGYRAGWTTVHGTKGPDSRRYDQGLQSLSKGQGWARWFQGRGAGRDSVVTQHDFSQAARVDTVS